MEKGALTASDSERGCAAPHQHGLSASTAARVRRGHGKQRPARNVGYRGKQPRMDQTRDWGPVSAALGR